MQPDPQIIEELVQRIKNAVQPLRIILFGSAARSTMKSDSDFDILVIMPEGVHRRHTAQYLHQQLIGFNFPVDILVATPTMLERYRHNPGLVYSVALKEGKDIYVAPAA